MGKLRLFCKMLMVDGKLCLNRRKVVFIKRYLNDDENLDLISSILYCSNDVFPTDKIRMVDFINYYGIENTYLGLRSNIGSKGQMRGEIYSYPSAPSRLSVFRHYEFDTYYYDLLDQDRRCESIPKDELVFRDGCSGMENISNILEKEKIKIRR